MSSKKASPLSRLWYRWKTLPLPWRTQRLVGMDLEGNTFWEFRDARSAEIGRMRRVVKYPRSTQYSEVKVSPAWHQWLRHTRPSPPSIEEQRADVSRQERMKVLAAEADARWAAKPGVMDAPAQDRKQPAPALASSASARAPGALEADARDAQSGAETENTPESAGDREQSWRKMQEDEKSRTRAPVANDPWKRARGGPSEEWQPQAWDPAKLGTKK